MSIGAGTLGIGGDKYYHIGGGYRNQFNNAGSADKKTIERDLVSELNRLKRNHNFGLVHAVATSKQTWAIEVMRELGFYESPVQLDLHYSPYWENDKDTEAYGPNGFHFVMFFMPVDEWEIPNEN